MPTVRTYIAGTTTDVAPVAALPTTAAHLALWNGEPIGGKVYTITSIGLTTTTSAAATLIVQPIAHVGAGPVGAIGGTVCQGPKALDGLYPASKAQAFSAVTILNTGVWHPVGQAVNSAALTATIGLGTWTNVTGIYLIQPGCIFSLAAFCNAAASAKCSLFVTWSEA